MEQSLAREGVMNAATISKVLSLLLVALILTSSGAVRAEPRANQWTTEPISCGVPRDAEEAERCADWQRQIMEATVFLRFSLRCGWKGDRSGSALVASHATIVDSRTLLTHDHFDSLVDPNCTVVALEVAGARNGLYFEIEDVALLGDLVEQMRQDATGSHRQAQLVAFPTSLFASTTPVEFASFEDPLTEETLAGWGELAEVNWAWFRGSTRVQWVHPLRVEERGEALGLVVDRAVEIGASGGGVFRITPEGIAHVGNVWGTWKEDDTSIVALNQGIMLKPNADNP
ncbi:MAG: hypothetical protein MUC51_15965 [Anaerolineae bacterium]|jgi:hypothetical protein|nr:hypothetical protein [Anaerolineae bacterium]